jgi:single-strand DNA-binding protein
MAALLGGTATPAPRRGSKKAAARYFATKSPYDFEREKKRRKQAKKSRKINRKGEAMFHTLIICGNLGRDPEMRYLPDGKPVTSFSVAVNDGFGDNKKTIWVKVTAWEKQAETCNQYLKKGSKVLVEGRLQSTKEGECRTWADQGGKTHATFEMTATTVRFLSSPKETEESEGDEGEAHPNTAQVKAQTADVPF